MLFSGILLYKEQVYKLLGLLYDEVIKSHAVGNNKGLCT